MKTEVKQLLLHHGISQFRIRPVRRDYAFEQAGVPHGQQWVLKICYAGTLPQLPLGLSGGCQLDPRLVIPEKLDFQRQSLHMVSTSSASALRL